VTTRSPQSTMPAEKESGIPKDRIAPLMAGIAGSGVIGLTVGLAAASERYRFDDTRRLGPDSPESRREHHWGVDTDPAHHLASR
jgi:hypothetical protein